MVVKKKPEGQEFANWCKSWDEADHKDKMKLATASGITYDTAKHWRSECDIPCPPRSKEEGKAEADFERIVGEVTETVMGINEILDTRSKVELDVVGFDIETTNLTADFSILLCACIKPFGKEPITFRADDYPSWAKTRSDDSAIVADIAKELGRHSIVVTHYGSRFDLPYMRTKMTRYGMPPLAPMFGVDTFNIAKKNYCMSRRRLANLASYFQLGHKEGVEGNLWVRAGLNGDRESMDAIVEHCKIDVAVLEKLAQVSFPYLQHMRRI